MYKVVYCIYIKKKIHFVYKLREKYERLHIQKVIKKILTIFIYIKNKDPPLLL